MGVELDLLVVNALYPERFTDDEAERIEQAAESNGSPGVEAALKAALFEHHRARTQRAEVARLTEEIGHEPVTLPYLFEPELNLDSFERLAADLERSL
jgi:hypothetical protein